MSEGVETVLGEVSATARLPIGSELLRLLLTNTRIIIIHVGKRGVGALATASTLGKIGAALEDLFKTSKESIGKRRRGQLSLEELLSSDRDNFPLNYDDIVRIELDPSIHVTWITVLTKMEKFQFSTRMDLETLTALFRRALGEKVVSKRISR